MENFDQRFSSSFISLVLKVSNPTSLDDFHSILLLGWVHNLVTQVLVAKLRIVFGRLVRDTQSGLIRGRNIFERWMVAVEVVDEFRLEVRGLS